MKKFFLIILMVMIIFISNETLAKDNNNNNNNNFKNGEEYLNSFEKNHKFSNDEIFKYYEIIGDPIDDIDEVTYFEYKYHHDSIDDYFSWDKWISRNGVWSLSLMPISINKILKNSDSAWDLVVEKHSISRHWRYYSWANETMSKQFFCHLYLAQDFKTPWNLEPSRPPEEVGFNCN